MSWGNLVDAKTIREFIYPHGARITLRLERDRNGHQFNVERQVNGGWQQQSYGLAKKGADRTLEEWTAFSERIGATTTTNKWEKSHCPWCEQKLPKKGA